MSKKLLYTVLAGALSVSVLAACGDGTDDPNDPNAPMDDPAMGTEDDLGDGLDDGAPE
ncbi:hypothetical protein [Alkalihalobacillus trypoxylicola]|uniref:hypothetical protein n=1 Tax=Alkalihalobacillus trypoxylicola TaxID=519424 RepID=UPI000435A3ED|nr:hypothetical protein [Alkalihalobacillus trypoxylicola]GAF66289.1 hypothetical protein BTS2_3189 [Bacillus sp. TS-2]